MTVHVDPSGGGPRPRRTRVQLGELISAGSALLLLVLMFTTEWYGVAGVPDPSYARPAISGAEDGWDGLTIIRWVVLATIVVAIGSVVQRGRGTETGTGRLVATLGTVSSLLLAYRVLIVLPGGGAVIDQKLGAVLGLVCALGIAWGGYESILELRTLAAPQRGRRSLIPPGRRSQ